MRSLTFKQPGRSGPKWHMAKMTGANGDQSMPTAVNVHPASRTGCPPHRSTPGKPGHAVNYPRYPAMGHRVIACSGYSCREYMRYARVEHFTQEFPDDGSTESACSTERKSHLNGTGSHYGGRPAVTSVQLPPLNR